MFIPIMDFEEDVLDKPDETHHDSSCGCCKIDPNTNQRGTCICTDCKCHLRTRKQSIFTDPIVLYGVISAAMMTILFLVTK